MSTDSADRVLPAVGEPVASVEELIELAGAKKIRSVEDIQALAVDVFESDEELDEFLEFTYANRHQEVFD
jgi:hypothetical protein